MKLGYARVSTNEQDTAAQVSALKSAGCEKIFREKASGGRWDRPAGFNLAGETNPEHAYWAEFHDSRTLVTATRAGALTFGVHRLGRYSALNRSRKHHHAPTEWRESGQHAPGQTVVPFHK